MLNVPGIVTSIISVARSKSSSIDVTPLVPLRTRTKLKLDSSIDVNMPVAPCYSRADNKLPRL